MGSEDDLNYKLGEDINASIDARMSEQEGCPAHIVTVRATLQVCAIEYAFGWSLFLTVTQFEVAR